MCIWDRVDIFMDNRRALTPDKDKFDRAGLQARLLVRGENLTDKCSKISTAT